MGKPGAGVDDVDAPPALAPGEGEGLDLCQHDLFCSAILKASIILNISTESALFFSSSRNGRGDEPSFFDSLLLLRSAAIARSSGVRWSRKRSKNLLIL